MLEQAADRAAFPIEQLGDLEATAKRYNELWLELERTSESTDTLRIEILSVIFDELELDDKSDVRTLAQSYDEIRKETGVRLYPNVRELLCNLKTNYKLGLLTNGPSDISWEKIRELEFEDLFDAIVVAGDVKIYKPDRRVFEMLLSSLSVPAANTLFVGDNYAADIVGAHQLGMSTAWINRVEDATWESVEPTIVTSDTASLREVLL